MHSSSSSLLSVLAAWTAPANAVMPCPEPVASAPAGPAPVAPFDGPVTPALGELAARCDIAAPPGTVRIRRPDASSQIVHVPAGSLRPYLMRALADLLRMPRAIDDMGALLRGYRQAAAGSAVALAETDIPTLLPALAAYAAAHAGWVGAEAAKRVARMDPVCGAAILRRALGLPAVPDADRFQAWLAANAGAWATMLPYSPTAPVAVVDFGSTDSAIAAASAAEDRAGAERHYAELQRASGCEMAVGRWLEQRVIYRTTAYRSAFIEGARRDCHLGVDLFMPAGTPLRLPMDGVVVAATVIDVRQDYGGMLVLAHTDPDGCRFWSLWGHLSHASPARWNVGDHIPAGTEFARLGDFEENGWWLPHLHFQLCLGRYDDFSAMPGVGEIEYAEIWAALFPDPTRLVMRQ